MQELLYKYLLINHKLSIPALGNFEIGYKRAQFNESTGLLFPGRPSIEFNEGPATGSDKDLVNFLATEMGTDESTVSKELQNYSINLLVSMVEQHHIDLKGIGRIKKESIGNILFTPASNLLDILPPMRLGEKVKIGKVLKENTEIKSKEIISPVPVPVSKPVIPEAPKPVLAPVKPLAAVKPIPAVAKKEAKPVASAKNLKSVKEPVSSPAKDRSARNIAALVMEMRGGVPPAPEPIEEEIVPQKTDAWWKYAIGLVGLGLVGLLIYLFIH